MSDNKLPIKREFSSGGCVYKRQDTSDKIQVLWLIGKHSGYHKWVLPKGMIEEGEKGIETAIRETKEEMGVEARVIGDKPIHTEKYWFVATLDTKAKTQVQSGSQPIRRVSVYQEDPQFTQTEDKIKVFKTVTFYLMEYVAGDPKDHDWEMEDAGWFSYEEAMEMLSFEGEKKALDKANKMITN